MYCRKNYRRWLLKAVGQILLPEIDKSGFFRVNLEGSECTLNECYPFGRHQRARGDLIDVLEVELKRHGEPAFRISAGTVSKLGYEHEICGYVAAIDVWSGYLPNSYVFYSIPIIERWFSIPFYSVRKLTENDFFEYVKKISFKLISEIDGALILGCKGSYVKSYKSKL